jgi:hypothetical protein
MKLVLRSTDDTSTRSARLKPSTERLAREPGFWRRLCDRCVTIVAVTATVDTLGDSNADAPRPLGSVSLIHLGSSENQFREAGAVWALNGIRRVRFGRGTSDKLDATSLDGVLHVGIPLGWVSTNHAEMRLAASTTTPELALRDLGSRNGTHIEQQPVPGIARLEPGQVFEMGRSFWMVRNVPADAETGKVTVLDPAGTANPKLCAIHRTLARLATSDVPLLFEGETGTGKEVTARAVHRASGREGAFVHVNSAAWTDDRLDALLTAGPDEDRPGLLERARGGTLYLAELGELTPLAQSKLLAALGSARELDVRVIGSSLHDLHALVDAGRFRADLYSRLAGFTAILSPLRERREDLGILTQVLSQTRNGNRVEVATRAFRRVLAHGWPFNVRELGQTLATASILAGTGGQITREVLEEILERRRDMPSNPDTVSELRARLVSQLAKSRGDTAAVARAMARDQREIHRWLERFDLEPDAYRS